MNSPASVSAGAPFVDNIGPDSERLWHHWDNHPDGKVSSDERSIALMERFSGKSLKDWKTLGVTVFGRMESHRDGSETNSVFTLSGIPPGERHIRTGNVVGVVRLRDRETGTTVRLSIGSRFDQQQPKKHFFLTYLLSKVFGGNFVDQVEIGGDNLWDLLLAFVFCRKLIDASAVGLFKRYQTRHGNDTRFKGAVDLGRHLRENIPFRGTLAYRAHEHTFDNPINHLIRHALRKIEHKGWHWVFQHHPEFRTVRRHLEENTPGWHPQALKGCLRRKEVHQPVRHPYFSAHYEPLRLLSLSLLADDGASLYDSGQKAEGVLFDAAWLWEEYLWTLLKPLDKFVHPQNTEGTGAWRPLHEIRFYPDFHCLNGDLRVILDAKYKRSENRSLEDVRQVFAYMFLADARHGGLIKPIDLTEKGGDRGCAYEKIRMPHFPNADSGRRWWDLSLCVGTRLGENASAYARRMHAVEEQFRDCIKTRILEGGPA